MQITEGQLEYLFIEEGLTLDNGTNLAIVEEGEWEQGPTFQLLRLIFTDGERNYCGYIGRSGSPYMFDSEIHGVDALANITEVKQVEVVKTVWKAVR